MWPVNYHDQACLRAVRLKHNFKHDTIYIISPGKMKYSSTWNYPATLMLLACCSQYRQLGPEPMSFQIIVCILCQWPEGDLGAIPIKSYVVINVMWKKSSASLCLNGFNISLSTTEKQTNKFAVNPNAYWNISTVMWKATVISFSAFSSYVVPDEIKREILSWRLRSLTLGRRWIFRTECWQGLNQDLL